MRPSLNEPIDTPDFDHVEALKGEGFQEIQTLHAYLPTTPTMRALIHEAAEKRGLRTTQYIYRAVLAVVAYDLGIPWALMSRGEPLYRDRGTQRLRKFRHNEFGPWEIVRMREGKKR